ncbi:hypothetical protein GCM10008986_01140 [Salinibacillus aidingensis]|uniref:Uncharacterized protein n=1 Tax=Salinibacillus aidingensis TaxID=237684 RepID=A0ABP3KHW5_9BACI
MAMEGILLMSAWAWEPELDREKRKRGQVFSATYKTLCSLIKMMRLHRLSVKTEGYNDKYIISSWICSYECSPEK